MSPEQADAKHVGPQSDIFTLGSVLVCAATGRPPFSGDSISELRSQIVSGVPDLGPLSQINDPLVGLIRKCLSKDPADRPTLDEIKAARPRVAEKSMVLPEAVRSHIARRRKIVELMATPRGTNKASPSGGTVTPRPPWSVRTKMITTAVVAAAVTALLVYQIKPDQPLPPGPTPLTPTVPQEPPATWHSALEPCPAGSEADIELRITSSKDKDTLLREMAADYGIRSASGRCVGVVVDGRNSGSATNELVIGWPDPAKQDSRPDVWIPTSSS
jgi:serine/threonine protein kinase